MLQLGPVEKPFIPRALSPSSRPPRGPRSGSGWGRPSDDGRFGSKGGLRGRLLAAFADHQARRQARAAEPPAAGGGDAWVTLNNGAHAQTDGPRAPGQVKALKGQTKFDRLLGDEHRPNRAGDPELPASPERQVEIREANKREAIKRDRAKKLGKGG